MITWELPNPLNASQIEIIYHISDQYSTSLPNFNSNCADTRWVIATPVVG